MRRLLEALLAFALALFLTSPCVAGEIPAPTGTGPRIEIIQAGGETSRVPYVWRVKFDKPSRIAEGYYSVDGNAVTAFSSSVHGTWEGSNDAQLELTFSFSGSGLRCASVWASVDRKRQARRTWDVDIPAAAVMRTSFERGPVSITGALTPVWKAEFAVGGRTVKTIVWAVKVADGEGDDAPFLRQDEGAEAIRIAGAFTGAAGGEVNYQMNHAEDQGIVSPAQAARPRVEQIDPAKAEALLKEFNEIYRLDDGEDYRLVMSRRPQEARHAYWVTQYPNDAPRYARDPYGFSFQWENGKLVALPYSFPGHTIADVIVKPLGLGAADLEGDDRMLARPVPADVIWRTIVPEENMVKAMNKAFAKEFVVPLVLSFREVESDVYIARGAYQYRPSPSVPPAVGVDSLVIEGTIRGTIDTASPSGTGSLTDALRAVGQFIGVPVICEATSQPSNKINWYVGYRWRDEETLTTPRILPDGEAAAVLRNVREQTGLEFSRGKRSLRKLAVTLSDSVQ